MPFHALMSFLVPIPSLRTSLPPVFTWLPLTHCGGLDDNLLKAYVHVEPVNVTLCGKRVFAHAIKDLKIRPFWITQLGPKSNDKRPYKGGGETQRQPREGTWRQRLESCCHKPRRAEATKSWRRQGRKPPLAPLEGTWLCQHLYFGLLVTKTGRM